MTDFVMIHYLEMNSPDELRPARAGDGMPAGALQVMRAEIALPALNRFFYVEVGRDWEWTQRLVWTAEQWRAWADRPEMETWVGYVRGTPIGYYELERQGEGTVEIAYFGLLPDFTGRGFGGQLLTNAVERAWAPALGAATRRVWVNTCTLDHPAALANYLARGFVQFREETKPRAPSIKAPSVAGD